MFYLFKKWKNMFEGFFDNLLGGTLNPKGNLGDARHASRTFVKNSFRLAPKVKFLYHVAFKFSPAMQKTLSTWEQKHKLEAGLLVKDATLPSFTANVQAKKKYNRTKQIQTGLNYNPVTINFHDDNLGIITGMLEAYYRYYFVDGNYGANPIAYNKSFTSNNIDSGDSTYKNEKRNMYGFGLHRGITDPFIISIELSQMTRHTFTTYSLVNPIITDWNHGTIDSATGSATNDNSMTVAYETVWIDRGAVDSDGAGEPTGFGNLAHYDATPSPNTLVGGGSVSLGAVLSGGVDLFDYTTTGKGFSSPLAAVIGGVNLVNNIRNLSVEGVKEDIGNLISGANETFYDNTVSGLPNTQIPK